MLLNLKKMYSSLQRKVLIGVRVYWTAWAFLYTYLLSKHSMWNNSKTRLKIEKCHTPRARENGCLKKCIPKHLQSRGPQRDDEYFANFKRVWVIFPNYFHHMMFSSSQCERRLKVFDSSRGSEEIIWRRRL